MKLVRRVQYIHSASMPGSFSPCYSCEGCGNENSPGAELPNVIIKTSIFRSGIPSQGQGSTGRSAERDKSCLYNNRAFQLLCMVCYQKAYAELLAMFKILIAIMDWRHLHKQAIKESNSLTHYRDIDKSQNITLKCKVCCRYLPDQQALPHF